jgi:hypothetical protein
VKGKRQNDKLKQNLYPLTLILGPQRILEKRFLSSEERSFFRFHQVRIEKSDLGNRPLTTDPWHPAADITGKTSDQG